MNKTIVALSAALFTTVNYAVWETAANNNLETFVQIQEMRNKINLDENRELHKILLNDVSNQTTEIIKNQGKIEGIVDYIANPKEYYEVWHQGYQKGLNQTEEMKLSVKDNLKEIESEKPKNVATP
jgi:hypothetical protein